MSNHRTACQKDGDFGEQLALAHLSLHGYRCLAANFHSRFGEIDLIAANDCHLLFVEVKTRRAGAMISALEAVTPAKQRRLLATAEAYLAAHPSHLQPRFDVICVELDANGNCLDLEWLENAF